MGSLIAEDRDRIQGGRGFPVVFKRSKPSESVTFVLGDEEKSIRLKPGKTILDLALENDLPLDHSCTAGTCGSCRIFVLSGNDAIETRGEVEEETAEARGFGENERLACLNEACGSIRVRIPTES